jgi:hypothetical protein
MGAVAASAARQGNPAAQNHAALEPVLFGHVRYNWTHMNAIIGGWILLGLVIALFLARRAAVKRKKREQQLRRASRSRKPRPERMTDRAEMRANDDPTTFAHNTTTHGRATDTGAPRSEPPRKR